MGDDKYILFVYKLSSSWILTLMETSSYWVLLKVQWLNFFGYPRSAQVTPNPTTKNESEVKNYGVLSYILVF
jgi:hypothetical protein